MADQLDNALGHAGGVRPEVLETARIRLARLPLVAHALEIGGRDWEIEAVADQSALTAVADELQHFPFGLMLWEAAPVLAEDLVASGAVGAGRSVLELGAGVGLTGLVAAALGASVVQTDHSIEALALAALNAARNRVTGTVQAPGDWLHWQEERRFDVILGSDILYDAGLHGPVLSILERNLAPGGRVLLSDPGRSTTPAFLALLASAGWRVERKRRRVPSLAPLRPGETVVITLIEAT